MLLASRYTAAAVYSHFYSFFVVYTGIQRTLLVPRRLQRSTALQRYTAVYSGLQYTASIQLYSGLQYTAEYIPPQRQTDARRRADLYATPASARDEPYRWEHLWEAFSTPRYREIHGCCDLIFNYCISPILDNR